jgi:dephospho-CoA kinase
MMKNKIYAITGGIGSGKSTVARAIAGMGYPVFSCDEVYDELLKSGAFTTEFLANFGNVFEADGSLNRKKLSEIVFQDKNKLALLNKITHDKVMQECLNRARLTGKTAFVEVQLLFEEGYEKLFDGVIVVLRKKSDRIAAVMARDGLPQEKVIVRIDSQFDYDSNDFEKWFKIVNCGSLTQLLQNTEGVVRKILSENS